MWLQPLNLNRIFQEQKLLKYVTDFQMHNQSKVRNFVYKERLRSR